MAEEASRALMRGGLASSPSNHGGGYGAGGNSVTMMTSISGNVGMLSQHQQGRRTRRWYLGIQSKKDPAHVMTEVYKALGSLGCEWLQLSSYRIKCRWFPNRTQRGGGLGAVSEGEEGRKATEKRRREDSATADNEDGMMGDQGAEQGEMMKVMQADGTYAAVPDLCSPAYSIKIGLTLYKVQHSIYLLDFQKINGDSFSFMTLCANIISELKTLSAANKLKQQQAMAALQQQMQMQQEQEQGLPPAPPTNENQQMGSAP